MVNMADVPPSTIGGAETAVPDAPIRIASYDSKWPALFGSERVLLRKILAPWLAGPIEHIGSTAVPGLSAKPIIDIMAAVKSLEGSRAAIDALGELEYRYAPYRADVMHWFCKPGAAHRTHHLHLVPFGTALWRERIAFRDRLRADAALAAEYAELKRHFARVYRTDREAYTEAKGAFISRALGSAPRSV
jgi:GrpB-like predicted nucleotidyltransferase (UPF0157 family)